MTLKWLKLQKGKVCDMNYHNITKDDMLNGDGLRVVLWVSGCNHCCKNCHNSITWDANEGLHFDESAEQEIWEQLQHEYISGVTFSGGDPLFPDNRKEIKTTFSSKNNMVLYRIYVGRSQTIRSYEKY